MTAEETDCTVPRSAQPGKTEIFDWEGFGFETRQVHAGEYRDLNHDLRVPPLALSAGYIFNDFDDCATRFSNGGSLDRIYSRQGNPTNTVAERRITSLEGAAETVLTSSGQAAITAALFVLAGSGDKIVSTASIYGGTRILFGRSFKRMGIDVDYVWDLYSDAEWDAAITPETKAIYAETLPNPLNDITDLRKVSEVAKRHNLPLVVDNTVGTPALVLAGQLGADIIVHSTTKFMTGHGTAVGGAVVDMGTYDWANSKRSYPLIQTAPAGKRTQIERFGNRAYAGAVREAVVNDVGFAVSPLTGFLIHQGLETLSLRMQRHTESSLEIARWLEEQPEVTAVAYAGLESNPYHSLALRDYPRGTGSVFGVEIKHGKKGVRELVNNLTLWSHMTGIGDTRSMVIHPRTSTHMSFDEETNERLGISEGLLRLSVGLETTADLIKDFRTGLDAVAKLG